MPDHGRSEASTEPRLRGHLGIVSIILMVIATAAPLTVMVANSPLIIGMGNGMAAPFDAAVATIVMLLFTAGFVRMAPHISNAGAFYAYIQKGLGRVMGLGAASLALTSYFCILIAIEAYIGVAISGLIRDLAGLSFHWLPFSIFTILVIGMLGYRDVELSSIFLGIALVLEIGVVLVIDLAIAVHRPVTSWDLSPFNPQTILSGSPGLGLMFAIYCFIGFEATVVFREEARDPDRTIPRATYLAVLITGAFYIVSMWCEIAGLAPSRLMLLAASQPDQMYLILAQEHGGTLVRDTVHVLVVTSLFACMLSLHNIIVRYKFVLARLSLLPFRLSHVHAVHGSPHVASVAQTAISLVTLCGIAILGVPPVTGVYAFGATAGTIGYIVILMLTCLSVIVYFSRMKERLFWQTKVAPALAFLALALCLAIALSNLPALIGGTYAGELSGAAVAVIGLPFFGGLLGAAYLRAKKRELYESLKKLA